MKEPGNIWISKSNSILYEPFKLIVKPMQIFGMYPINGMTIWMFRMYAALLHVILTISLPLFTILFLFAQNDLNIRTVMDALFMFSEIGITILKYLTIRSFPEKTKKVLDWLTVDLFNTYHEDQKKIVQKTSESCRNVYLYFLATCMGTLFTWNFRPLFNGADSLQTTVWLPYDPFANNYVYTWTYCAIFLGNCNAAFGNSSLDCLITGLICQAAGQIKIIKSSMKDIIRHAEESIDNQKKNLSPEDCEKLKNNYIYKDICLCVDRYNLVKEFVNDIEDTFSIPLFWQFGASVFVICLGYLQFFFVELWSFNFFTIVSFVVTMSWEVFLYCYFGSILYNESASLITDIYVTDWLNLDIKCQKALITIMENGKRPLIIRAGKIVDLSLDTFATILKRAYSVMAVVNKFIEN